MAIDLNRNTSGVDLPEAFAAQVWRDAQEASAVAQLASPITLPGSGLSIPLMTGDVVADWVDETDEKPVSRPTFSSKHIKGYTMAVIVPVSNQFRRDAAALYSELLRSLPGALAAKLDSTVFGGTSPGTGFDVLTGATAQGIGAATGGAKAAEGFLDVLDAVEAANGTVDGWALAPQGRSLLRRAVDADGRPLLMESFTGSSVSQVLGSPVYTNRNLYKVDGVSSGVHQLGYGGEFSGNLFLGFVEGVSVSISDQASITDGTTDLVVGAETVQVPNVINLWQRNMFAVRAEFEVGVAVRDLDKIRKLSSAAATA